jgi:hypothetical protein
MKLREFMCDHRLTSGQFDGPSWRAYRDVIAPLWDGDSDLIPQDMHATAYQLLGCERLPPPGWLLDELYLGFGRRCGKTMFEAVAVTHAWAQDYRDRMAPGEWATISCHCVDKRQARTLFGYVQGIIEASETLRAEVSNSTAESIESAHRTRFEIHTASFRSIRGYTLALACLDEASFMRDETSATPDVELYRAVLPALATLGGRLIVTSSLHRKVGLMWNKHQQHWGKAA